MLFKENIHMLKNHSTTFADISPCICIWFSCFLMCLFCYMIHDTNSIIGTFQQLHQGWHLLLLQGRQHRSHPSGAAFTRKPVNQLTYIHIHKGLCSREQNSVLLCFRPIFEWEIVFTTQLFSTNTFSTKHFVPTHLV